jgi:predicted RNA-binding protein with PUA-like domain
MKYWLLKSEESCYSIDDLKKDNKTLWSGVRNYQARNYMREMSVGDMCLFYHSSSKPTGIVGICKVTKKAVPDITALNPYDDHYDQKSSAENPIWECVEVTYLKHFKKIFELSEMRNDKKLQGMVLLQQGSRLSVQPVSKEHFEYIDKKIS